jgi:hypothetical protein
MAFWVIATISPQVWNKLGLGEQTIDVISEWEIIGNLRGDKLTVTS